MTAIKPTLLADDQVGKHGLEDDLRDSVHREAATPRRAPDSGNEAVANNLGAMLQRVAGSSQHEIDRLVHELQSLRDLLETEGERVQREIAEYVQLSKSSMQSTKIIAEGLAHWKSVADKHRA